MRKLLLLAVSVSLVFTASSMARSDFKNYAENTSKYSEQYDNSDDSSENDATDWEDHTVPDPQYDSQSMALAICGQHAVFINDDNFTAVIDGVKYKLLGTDYRQTVDNDVALIDHYVRNNNPKTMVSIMVLQKSKQISLYKHGDSFPSKCVKP